MRTALAHIPPVIVLLAAVAVGIVAGRYWMAPIPAQWLALVTTLLVISGGLLLILRAGFTFRRHQTSIHPRGQPTRLLRDGPFRFSRNPIYLGMLVISAAPYTWTGQPAALLAPLLFFVFIHNVTIPFEETRLRAAFPDDFPRYERAVRRWL